MEAQASLLKSMQKILKKHGAESAYKDLSALIQRYDVTKRVPANCSIETRINQFLTAKTVDGLSPKTVKDYGQQLRRFAAFVNKPPTRIAADDLRNYISELHSRGLKDTTVSTVINTLRSFFSWLISEEYIVKNPMAKIKPLRVDKKRLRNALSKEDIERLGRYGRKLFSS